MMVKSGRHDIALEKWTTRRSLRMSQIAISDTMPLAITVPTAAPNVPSAGNGP
jgi:hypothetical protein